MNSNSSNKRLSPEPPLGLGVSRRDFLKYSTVASAMLAFPGLAQAMWRETTADVIFHGGTIITMNPRSPRAEALAIAGERILAVGSRKNIDALRGSKTRVIDLGGRTLMPGMIDPHMHSSLVQLDSWVDVGVITTNSYDAVKAKLKQKASEVGPGKWVQAQLFDWVITPGAHIPTLAELDALLPDNPLFMLESNGHVAYANTKAFQAAGVSRDTPDPATARYIRDAQGNLTGRLEEMPTFQPFLAAAPRPSKDELATRVRKLFDHAASLGCTAMQDMSIGELTHSTADIEILNSVMKENPPIRYRGALISTLMDDWEKIGVKPNQGDDRFRLNMIKAWSDGAGQAFTAFQRENYLGKDHRGSANYTVEQLTDAIRRAHKSGWQVAVHANGDAGIDDTLEAYAAVLSKMPRADHRDRIEHCSVLHPEQITKMGELGLSPSFLIGHIRWWGRAFIDKILGPERVKFYDPCASVLAAGLRISIHSDYNVTPLGPLRCVQDAVTRVMKDGGGVFVPEERIPVEAALRAVTLDAAWQCRMDDICGSLEPGKYADLALLEQDPTKVDPMSLQKIKVSEIWLAGKPRHGA
jgi:predicted amidohydrolase YtcJ